MPYGISQAVWNRMNLEDRNQVIASYNATQEQEQAANNAAAANAAQTITVYNQQTGSNVQAPAPATAPVPTTKEPAPADIPPVQTKATSGGGNSDPSTPTTLSGGGDASSSTTTTTTTTTTPPVDWESILGEYGLPPDVIKQLNLIWQQANGDVNQAVTLATAYVRGTDWYKQTYPGIQTGINDGLFTDEHGYMTYKNQLNQLYQQYYGRAATSAELTNYITSGTDLARVGNQLQSQALQGTISDPLKALFTSDELKALTDEQAGIDTALGQKVSQEANYAIQFDQLYQTFYGRAMTRGELDSLTAQGATPQSVSQQFAAQGAVNAMNPQISGLFSQQELQQIGLNAAGGNTQNGQQLTDLANLAKSFAPVASQYGQALTRQQIEDAYSKNLTAGQYANQLQGNAYAAANQKDIQQVSGSFGEGQLTQDQLQSLGQEVSGYDTPEGQRLLAAYNKALQIQHGAFQGVLARLAKPAGASAAPDVAA